MRGFGLQRQRPVADQLRIAAVLLRKIGRWMPQYALLTIPCHSDIVFMEQKKRKNSPFHSSFFLSHTSVPAIYGIMSLS